MMSSNDEYTIYLWEVERSASAKAERILQNKGKKRTQTVIYKMYIQPLEILRHHFEIMKVVSYFPPRLYVY